MEIVAGVLVLIFVLLVVAGVYAAVRTVRTARRRLDVRVRQARRTVEDTRLRAKQLTQPGVVGELAELRLSLRQSMRATQEALRAAAPEDRSLSEALGLFERLSAHGHELDDDLRQLEREPDRAGTAARLPELRERTRRITRSAESLRWAAKDRAQQFAAGDLEALSREIELEAGALRHWTSDPDPGPRLAQGPSASAPAQAGSEPEPDSDAAASSRAAPEDGPGSRPEARPSIAPADPPRQQATPFWQKSPRPDGTP
ncbi:hypothetical protein RKE29_10145 [Streptomyces sp. B1866]|uniref:hypothetical protein n=1 Tax=Streptomyces sp. B1866 TaxID=3075431 RepID=UPI00288FC15B|nr:hypothetical protein [Streptomyces sp. B1866]MDT3397002.1 hypothetical protein [Streptomyces sp. B1866]